MRVLVYCPKASDSARQLVQGLRDAGVEALRRKVAPISQLREGDVVLCWGAQYDGAVNSAAPISKLQELEVLSAAGVYVPPFSRSPLDGYLARDARHQCGRDLLHGTSMPAFYTRRMDVSREYRVHVAGGHSIKVGQKRVRTVERDPDTPATVRCAQCGNETPASYVSGSSHVCVRHAAHPWIRSYASGWGIYYDANAREGFNSKGRELAKQAVQALGLQLAAVDLWKLEDGAWCVGEVNRRPALPAGSGVLGAYVKAVCKLVGVEVTP